MNIHFPKPLFLMIGSLVVVSLACQTTASPTEFPATSGPISPPVEVTSIPTHQGVAPVGLPAQRSNHAGDEDSAPNADRKMVSGGDKFVKGLFERPFNAESMDTYFPYLDIIETQGFKDDLWGYATITMSGTDAEGKLPGRYGVELDLNRDGRGEWLILASNPSSTEWMTTAVQAWSDANQDIGSAVAMVADEHPRGGDGYETLIFDQGKGDPPDGAWVRISETDPKTVVIAFKLSMIGDPDSFAMGVWAGNSSLDPSLFDHNDHMTHVQAGSPLPDLNVYPLKQLAEIDNTCRMAINFTPTGNEPGLCETTIKQEAGQPVAGCTPVISVVGGPPSGCP